MSCVDIVHAAQRLLMYQAEMFVATRQAGDILYGGAIML